ncbi:hypothetical protein K4B79_43805 [Streptomyces lincolnensis]|uniref:hypothetical protein n=1 Tax=Streptomyces lincolnensis TaxID=1915 RepID=UPI001E4E05AD|nr:hypothetical protein [Streptomyces lincolnensis]MCD7445104.1 hypothetical protein [Streptomyces lincolnensis]
MRTHRALAATGAAVALLGFTAPTAAAWDQPTSVSVLPSVIARGGQLQITVTGSACTLAGSTVSSNAFPTTPLVSQGGSGNTSTATATVNANAGPGAYSVTTNCEGKAKTFTNAFTVIGGVRGGIGGSSSTGATPTDMAIGGGLVAAAVIGGGVFWMRRRSEKRI